MAETTNIDAKGVGKLERAATDAKARLEKVMAALQDPGMRVDALVERCTTIRKMSFFIAFFIVIDVVFFDAISAVEVTGLITVFAFVFMTRNIDEEFSSTVDCLASTKSIQLQIIDKNKGRIYFIDNDDKKFMNELSKFKSRISCRSSAWLLVFVIVFFAMAVYYLVYIFEYNPYSSPAYYLIPVWVYFSLVILVIAMAIGARLGRMACLGFRLVYAIGCEDNNCQIRFKPVPGHADGKCGLKAINSFFVYQVECAFFLFFYILFWCLVFILGEEKIYAAVGAFNLSSKNLILPGDLADATVFFLVILMVVFALQVFGILSPVMGIRKIVLEERDCWREKVEPTSRRILVLRLNLRREIEEGGKGWEDIKFEIEEGGKLVRDVENMGYWPFSWDSIRPIMLLSFEFIMVIVPIILKA